MVEKSGGAGFTVLCIDDERGMLESYTRLLRSVVDHVYTAETPAGAADIVQAHDVRLVLLDLRIPGHNALAAIEEIKAVDSTVSIIVITGHATVSDAVAALKAGASDFLEKPVNKLQLQARIEPLQKIHRLEREAVSLKRSLDGTFRFPAFVGSSLAIRQIKSTIVHVARTEATVMIAGETGTGKEVVAQAIHAHSNRANGPFIVVDCGSIGDSIIESELFGHKKGAFTGALESHEGLIRAAHGGTLFLDEIGELSLEIQTKFLRVLQQHEVRPIGTTQAVPADIRVISATNKDIKQAMADGQFREDLYYRLNTVVLNLPPLRDHREDVVELAEHFLSKHRPPGAPEFSFSAQALQHLLQHSWPGNNRELENVVLRAVAFARNGTIEASDVVFDSESGAFLSERQSTRKRTEPEHSRESAVESLEEHEKRVIERALAAHGGNKKAAAKQLGIAESTLHRKLKRMR